MVRIYYTSFHERLSHGQFDRYLAMVPDNMKQQVLRYRRWEDSHACLFGKLLLRQSMVAMDCRLELENIRYTNYGKPFIEGNTNFSISHSGTYVLCAISNEYRVGLDIEQVRDEVEINEFKSQFFHDEWNKIVNSQDPVKTFFSFWTSKEAAMKADGRGLSIINDTRIADGFALAKEQRWNLKDIELDSNYIVTLATSKPLMEEVILERLDFQQ
jgi:4'-phosphopantetheinyl transferase